MDPKMYAKKVEEFLSKKSWADSRTYKCDSVYVHLGLPINHIIIIEYM